MVAVRILIPAGQSTQQHVRFGQSDTHVAIATFADYFHLEIIDAARGRYGIVGTDACCVLVRLAGTFVGDA